MVSSFVETVVRLTESLQKNLALTLFALVLVSGLAFLGYQWFRAPKVVEQCASIPATGHVIESARAGEWATVTWRDIQRFQACSKPEVTGVVVNGDGIYHDVKLTTGGVALEVGMTPELRYKFKIPQTASAGRAWFAVTVNFPAEGQTVNSPRVYFKIEGENPHD